MKPTLHPCQTCKTFCSSSLTLEAGKLSTIVSSMVSMASRVCKEAGELRQCFLPSLPAPGTDRNSRRQGRTPAVPGGARERPRGRQCAACSAACGTGRGQAQRKGPKGRGWESKGESLPCLGLAQHGVAREQPRGSGGSCSSASPYLNVEGSVEACPFLLWRKPQDTHEAGF